MTQTKCPLLGETPERDKNYLAVRHSHTEAQDVSEHTNATPATNYRQSSQDEQQHHTQMCSVAASATEHYQTKFLPDDFPARLSRVGKLAVAKMVHSGLRIAPVLTKRSRTHLRLSLRCYRAVNESNQIPDSVQLLLHGVSDAVCFSLVSVVDAAPECRGGNRGARIVTKQ